MFSNLKVVLAGIVAFIAIVLSAFLKGRSNGKQEVQEQWQQSHSDDVEKVANERVQSASVSAEVKQEAIVNSDSTIDSDLESKWTRK